MTGRRRHASHEIFTTAQFQADRAFHFQGNCCGQGFDQSVLSPETSSNGHRDDIDFTDGK